MPNVELSLFPQPSLHQNKEKANNRPFNTVACAVWLLIVEWVDEHTDLGAGAGEGVVSNHQPFLWNVECTYVRTLRKSSSEVVSLIWSSKYCPGMVGGHSLPLVLVSGEFWKVVPGCPLRRNGYLRVPLFKECSVDQQIHAPWALVSNTHPVLPKALGEELGFSEPRESLGSHGSSGKVIVAPPPTRRLSVGAHKSTPSFHLCCPQARSLSHGDAPLQGRSSHSVLLTFLPTVPETTSKISSEVCFTDSLVISQSSQVENQD